MENHLFGYTNMVGLRIYNSLTGKKEEFKAMQNRAGVYVCGITPYDTTHLGHAFTYVFFDVVVRYLRYLGYRVTYVQNVTDIDDDILKKARELGKDWRELGEENTQIFLEDMRWLNNTQPDIYPRAKDHIIDMINLTKKLLSKGWAYERSGNVYFQIARFKEYGKLSKIPRKEMLHIANQRGNDPCDPNKKDPLDFVLWQAKKPGEPSWPSPWGPGRPGWHIECSAMALKYLGETIDIHGGGHDLIFPHHESSAAQSETVTGRDFVRYWMHTGMLRYRGEKMSKSLGNLVMIRDLKKKYSPNAVRICLLSHHYRTEWEFNEEELKKARKIDELFKRVWQAESGMGRDLDFSEHEKGFFNAMNDDFNTPKAIESISDLARLILEMAGSKGLAGAKAFLNRAFNILGLVMEWR